MASIREKAQAREDAVRAVAEAEDALYWLKDVLERAIKIQKRSRDAVERWAIMENGGRG
jgi:hypothetical protein